MNFFEKFLSIFKNNFKKNYFIFKDVINLKLLNKLYKIKFFEYSTKFEFFLKLKFFTNYWSNIKYKGNFLKFYFIYNLILKKKKINNYKDFNLLYITKWYVYLYDNKNYFFLKNYKVKLYSFYKKMYNFNKKKISFFNNKFDKLESLLNSSKNSNFTILNFNIFKNKLNIINIKKFFLNANKKYFPARFSEFSTNKFINLHIIEKFNFFYLRKNKIFNKGRYSRNRQIYRTGVYWCLWINIISVYGLYFLFYRFTFNFGYLWIFLIIFFGSFLFSRILKYNFISLNFIIKELIFINQWISYFLKNFKHFLLHNFKFNLNIFRNIEQLNYNFNKVRYVTPKINLFLFTFFKKFLFFEESIFFKKNWILKNSEIFLIKKFKKSV